MADINNISEDIISIAKIFFAPYADVDSIIATADGDLITTLKNGKDWQFFAAEWEEIKFTEKPEEKDGGLVFAQELKFTYFRNNFEIHQLFKALLNDYYIVRIVLSNADSIILGRPDNPCSIRFNADFQGMGHERSVSFVCTSNEASNFMYPVGTYSYPSDPDLPPDPGTGGNDPRITDTDITNWDAAYAHSQTTHADPDAITQTEADGLYEPKDAGIQQHIADANQHFDSSAQKSNVLLATTIFMLNNY